ncbi:hypothetical protein [Capnocytophaga leadbetteri]|jgi:hypothetical protein|uniref:hypothetical protein n=1 Tax=Capnocytophaga leadbetteri TaxID=327575 RepID=UPI0028D6A0F9|nr:hypothetical protein [Capnocytophaga leadbetteri]
MIKKIVFFDYHALSEQVYDHYYFSRLLAEGYEVAYFDLTYLYCPKLSKESAFEGALIHQITSFSDTQATTLYISHLTFTTVAGLFRLFKKYDCELAVFTRGGFPTLLMRQKLLHFSLRKYIRYTKMLFTLFFEKSRLVGT